MALSSRISEQEYRKLALYEPQWKLWNGDPHEEPAMSVVHDNFASRSRFHLQSQLDWSIFRVNVNGGKARVDSSIYNNTRFDDGLIPVTSLPGVVIDLNELLAQLAVASFFRRELPQVAQRMRH